MARSLRVVAIFLGGVLALLAVLLTALVVLVDPNDYRQQISQIAQEKAGITLTLGGDLGWSFYPVLGFDANNVSVALQPQVPALVQVKTLAVGVKLLPLLSKQIEIDGIEVDGLDAHLIVNADGTNNWQRPAAPPPAAAPATADNAQGALPVIRIPLVNIKDSQIRYEDKQGGKDYIVEVPRLQLNNVSLEEDFPLLLEARIREKAGLDARLKLSAELGADLAAKIYRAEDIEIDATVAGVMAEAITLDASGSAVVDQQKDTADLTFDALQLEDLKASLLVQAIALSTAPKFSGKLTTETFDAKLLLKTLGMSAPETRDPDAMRNVSLDVVFSGTPQQISVKPLTLVLDESKLAGTVAVTDLSRQAVQFDLNIDKISLDRYLAPDVATPETAAPATKAPATNAPAAGKKGSASTADAALLPVEALRTLNLQGKFTADELIVKEISVHKLGFSVNARDGDVRLGDVRAKLLDGTLQGAAGVDVRGTQPKITTQLALNDLKTEALLAPWVKDPVLSGRSTFRFDVGTQGNDSGTLLRQALGQLNVNIADGVLHGVNLNQLVADAVRQKMGNFTALMPDYETRLPKALKGDTQLRNLLANMRIENGHLITPDLKADSDAGQLNAKGDIDLVAQSFDYRFGVVLASLADHKYLKGTEWPVRCRGSLEAPVKDWCRPDGNAVGEVLKKAGNTALREKATEKLGEKLGIPAGNEAEVKEKAQEKVNQQINRQLDKWLNRDKKAPPATTP